MTILSQFQNASCGIVGTTIICNQYSVCGIAHILELKEVVPESTFSCNNASYSVSMKPR